MSQFPVLNGQLPAGFCPADLQTMLNGFSQQQYVNISTVSSIIVSSTTPGATDHDKAWLQLDSFGRPVRLYFFAQGAWLSPHPLFPGFTMIWPLALPEATNANLGFPTFDGGDNNAISAVSGPMWQLAKSTLDGSGTTGILGGRVPLGVGTLPSGAAIAQGATGGEDQHTLLPAEEGSIAFSGTFDVEAAGPDHFVLDTLAINGVAINSGSPGPKKALLNNDAGPHNVLNPYYGVYYLMRTNRLFYLVPP